MSGLTSVKTEALTLRGVSLGGVFTSIHVPELSALFDVGTATRAGAPADFLFLSHGHADHIGALTGYLGIRGLIGKQKPPTVYMPEEIVDAVQQSLVHMSELQRYDLSIEAVPMAAGSVAKMRGDLEVQAFATHHVVPSLGYSLVRNIKKLCSEFSELSGAEIARRKRAGEDLFYIEQRTEISYCTDTLIQALDNNPTLYDSRVLVLECTFLDERKTLKGARAGCHVHLDEILERAQLFRNQSLVLMHFSQLYKPKEVVEILDRRCPPELRERILPFVPRSNSWPG